jgi:hypothetical protein
MEKEVFIDLIGRLCAFFERKLPSPQTLEQWWEELRHVRSDFYPTIEKYLRQLDSWPRNFPGKVMDIYSQCKPKISGQEHPARFAPWKYAKADCQLCDGKGFEVKETRVFKKDNPERFLDLKARVMCPCMERVMYAF